MRETQIDFLDCLASAVHFEVNLLLNIFEIKKFRAITSIWYRICVRKKLKEDLTVKLN